MDSCTCFHGLLLCERIAGILILPDSPQMSFWLLSILLMLRIIYHESHPPALLFLLLGLVVGLCMLSKIHAVFLWMGFLLFILLYRRDLLRMPFLYISGLLSLLVFSPAIIWTIQNSYTTLKFHSSRVVFSLNHIQPDSFLRELAGSVLYTNPLVFGLILVSVTWFLRHKSTPPNARLLLCIAAPLISIVLLISIFNDTLPHWSGPAYLTLIPFTGLYFAHRNHTTRVPGIVKASLVLIFSALVAAVLVINYLPVSLGSKTMPAYGANDITLDMSGWEQFGKILKSFTSEIK